MDLRDASRQPFGAGWDDGSLITPGRNYDLIRDMKPVRPIEQNPVLRIAAQAPHGDPFQQWRIKRSDEGVDVADDLVAQHEAAWIRSLIRKARQLARPMRRHQTERVPALGPPGVPRPLLFEHHVVDAASCQMP